MQWGQSFLIPFIQQFSVCHHLQNPVARVDPPISHQKQKIIHRTIYNWSFPSVFWEDWQTFLTVFSMPLMNIHSNRLTRPQNEVQISSVCTSGPARPLIPACSSLTLVFPVYRRNGEEYSPQYPHHWEALSHSRAADKPKETFSELLPLFSGTTSREQQWLTFRISKGAVRMRNSVKVGKSLLKPCMFTCSTSVGRFFRPLGCKMARCKKLHPQVSFVFRSAPTKHMY